MNVFCINQGQGLKASGHTSLPKLPLSAPRACITVSFLFRSVKKTDQLHVEGFSLFT